MNAVERIGLATIGLGLFWIGCVAGVSAAAASEQDDDWATLRGRLATIKGVAVKPPAGLVTAKFTSGMLLGNGDIGVVAGDTVSTQKFYFAKGDFWGRALEAARNTTLDCILRAGTLVVSSPTAGAEPDSVYRMEQDILNAEVTTLMRLGNGVVRMRSLVAATDSIFVTEFSAAPGSQPAPIHLDLQMPEDDTQPYATGTTNGVLWATRENNLNGTNDPKARIALALKLVGASFNRITDGAANVTGEFTLHPGRPVSLVMVIRGDTKLGQACASVNSLREDAVRRAAGFGRAEIARLENAHRDWWKEFWLRSYVNLHDELLEKYYYGALYVLGSSARPGKLLPSMWGPFITSESSRWGGRHYLNYNAEAPYYGVAGANRPELILPYSDWILAELPYQVNRTHAAGFQGCTFQRSHAPLNQYRPRPPLTPVAAAKDLKRLPTDQKSNGSFAAVPLILYYDYTKDRSFLRDKLYPMLKELDAFWRDFIEREDLPGGGFRYVVRHTGAHEVANAEDVNPNLDVGYIRMVCRKLIDGSRELGVDAGMIPVWQDVLDHLSNYPTGIYGGKECFQECEVRAGNITDPVNLMHRTDQPINMEGAVHPGENVTLGGDPHWIQVGLDTYGYMEAWGTNRPMNNAFCKVWPQAARLGWPAEDFINKFKASLLLLWRESNLTCFQGGGGIETCGSIDAVNSMLLQSNFEEMRLFPVWPKERDASFKRLRAKGAFVVSSEFKGGKISYVDLVSEKGRTARIRNPWSVKPAVVETDPQGTAATREVRHALVDGSIEFGTEPGKRYRLTQGQAD